MLKLTLSQVYCYMPVFREKTSVYVDHASYASYLCDYFLDSKLKRSLKRTSFENIATIAITVTGVLKNIRKIHLQKSFEAPVDYTNFKEMYFK